MFVADVVSDLALGAALVREGEATLGGLVFSLVALPYVVCVITFRPHIVGWYSGRVASRCLRLLLDVLYPVVAALTCVGCDLVLVLWYPVHPTSNTGFLCHYERVRTVSEAALESLPQLALQIYVVESGALDSSTALLVVAVLSSAIAVLKNLLVLWLGARAHRTSFCAYGRKMLDGGRSDLVHLEELLRGSCWIASYAHAGNHDRTAQPREAHSMGLPDLSLTQVHEVFNAVQHCTRCTTLILRGNPVFATTLGTDALCLFLAQVRGVLCRALSSALRSARTSSIWIWAAASSTRTRCSASSRPPSRRRHSCS